jgi:hypothetical protein
MRRITAVGFIVLLGSLPIESRQQAPGTMVSGTIVDFTNRLPVPQATVLLERVDGPLRESNVVSANDRGEFVIRSVTPGLYRLVAEHEDHVRNEYDRRLSLGAGQSVKGLMLALTPTAVISGRVWNEFGDPVSRVVVRALTPGGAAIAQSRTDDRGSYRLYGLPPGVYRIVAERSAVPRIDRTFYFAPAPLCPDCRTQAVQLTPLATVLQTGAFIDPLALNSEKPPAVFYPGTTDRDAAQRLEIPPGGHLSGIDLRLVVR